MICSPQDASALFGIHEDTLSVHAFYHRRDYGCNPEWYIKQGKSVKIDVDKYYKYREIERKAWVHVTEELYYWLTYEPFQLTEMWLSERLANRSNRYNSPGSWRTFFTVGLFQLNEQIISKRWTQTLDFLVHGTALMRFLIEEAKRGVRYDV